jgi:hypothetical protein
MRGSRSSLVLTAVLLLAGSRLTAAAPDAAGAAPPDLIQLKDGRVVDGVPMRVEMGAVVLTYKSGEIRVPLDMLEDYVVAGVAPEPATDEAKAQRGNGQVLYQGKWMKPEQRDKLRKAAIDKKRADIADAKAHAEWRNRYQFETKYFKFESTLSQTQNEHYSALLDAYFEIFKKDWGLAIPKGFAKKLKVCVYPNEEEFQKRSGAGRGVGAYYKFVADANSERELNFWNDRGDARFTETCMFHECCHYVQDLFGEGKFDLPHFLSESMAEYYSGGTYDPRTKTLAVGQIHEGRLAAIKSDIDGGKRRPLVEMLSKTSEGEYEDYTWGWSFFHFMMQTPAYASKWKQFFLDVERGADVKRVQANWGMKTVNDDEFLRVFKKRMGIADDAALEKLQTEWYAYIDKMQTPGVRGQELAGLKAVGDGEWRFRGPRLLKKAIEMGSKNPEVYLKLSHCLRHKPEGLAEAFEVIKKGCEVDPLSADMWAERGFVLQLQGEKDAGKKLVDLAYELDPDGYYVDYLTIILANEGAGGK